eukprot:TRINITY_DN63639_c0_g1_i2.p1 TRINITY_DN63639_c0_g1~~TRINITY_DN63639_c0_g1_i2.p1  ORF type:complete len:605 (+),score=85.81 TRINITY_DN63639_c0_g1_i2:707-2521(+)
MIIIIMIMMTRERIHTTQPQPQAQPLITTTRAACQKKKKRTIMLMITTMMIPCLLSHCCGQHNKAVPVDSKEQLEKDEANIMKVKHFLENSAIPRLVSVLSATSSDVDPGASPIETLSITERFHAEGVNMRYLGRVANLAEPEFVKQLLLQEMIARVCKHKLREIMSTCLIHGEEFMASSIAQYLNAVFGFRETEDGENATSTANGTASQSSQAASTNNDVQSPPSPQQDQAKKKKRNKKKSKDSSKDVGNGVVEAVEEEDTVIVGSCTSTLIADIIKSDECLDVITEEVKTRFNYDAPDWRPTGWFPKLSKLATLRAVCLKVGIRILARQYFFNSPTPFTEGDIVELVPKVHQVTPRCTDAQELLQTGIKNLSEFDFELAFHNLQNALAFYHQVQGPLALPCITCLCNLSNVTYVVGDLESAVLFQHKALAVARRILGHDHPTTSQLHQLLGLLCHQYNNSPAAVKHLQRCYYLNSVMSGVDHPDAAVALANLGMVQQESGCTTDAIDNLKQALDISGRTAGTHSLQYGGCCYALSIAYSHMHNFKEAIMYQKQVYEAHHAVYGAENMLTQEADRRLTLLVNSAVTAKKAQKAVLKKGRINFK